MHYRHTILVLGSLAVAACTHPALSRFQTEHGCSNATIRDLGANAYRVEGCGRAVNYVCDPRAFNEAICIQESADRGPSPAAVSRQEDLGSAPRTWIEEGTVAGAPAVRLIVEELRRSEIVYAVAFDRDHVILRPASDLAPSCTNASFIAEGRMHVATARAGSAPTFAWDANTMDAVNAGDIVALNVCNVRVELRGEQLAVTRRFVERVRALSHAADPARSGSNTETGASPNDGTEDSTLTDHPSGTAAATRAWLNANRDAILGCANRATVIIRVEPSGAGARVSLQQPLAGTAEEECVRAALGSPPPASIPEAPVIHAVR